MRLIKSFIQGIMNKDLDERLVPDGQYRDALNIEVTASEGDGVGAVENIKGNTNVTNQTFTADAKTIGAIADDAKGDIYWFVADTDFDYVLKYNEYTGITTTLLKDSKTVNPVLKFDKRYLITGVNIIDNLLFWTDDLNPPRRLNVDRTYGTNAFIEDDISVIVRPPIYSPNITLKNSTSGNQENNIENKFIQFACRYKYENDEYSPICPFSATAFKPSNFAYDFGDGEFDSMINSNNEVDVDYYINGSLVGPNWVPDERIKEVQLLFRDTFNTNINVIESFNINDITIDANGRFKNTFSNSKVYTVLPPDEITRLFDNVPLKAKSQELIGSRIAYGNYVQFYDITDSSGIEIDIDYSLEIVPTLITSSPLPTFRSDRDYEIGLVYMDDYNRMTTVLTSDKNTIHVPPSSSDTSNDLRVSINSQAPSFANRYRVFIKQSKGSYYNIFPLFYYRDSVYRWFRINQSDVDKLKVGDYIIAKTSGGTPTYSDTQYKVLELGVKEDGFLGGNEDGGIYFKIKVEDTSIFNEVDIFSESWFVRGIGSRSNGSKSVDYIRDDGQTNNHKFGLVAIPVYYGNSTTRFELLNIPSYTNAPTPFEVPSVGVNKDYRLKIEIDGVDSSGNNTFKFYFFEGTGYVLQQNASGATSFSIDSVNGNEFYDYSVPGTALLCKLRFPYTSGYKIGDYWTVSIYEPWKNITNSTPLSQSSQIGIVNWDFQKDHPFAVFPGADWPSTSKPQGSSSSIVTQDRPISAGAKITIQITDQNGGDPGVNTPSQEFISPRDYVNIEEWFFESEAFKDFKHIGSQGSNADQGATKVFFKRGFSWQWKDSGTGDWVSTIAQSTTGSVPNPYQTWSEYIAYKTVFMCIKGTGVADNNQRPFLFVNFSIIQQDEANVFETVPTENDADIYYELSDTFDIVNGAHQGNVTNQVIGAQPAVVSLNPNTAPHVNTNYNAYCFGNGVESARIRGGFNEPELKYSPRVSSVVEDYQQQRVEEAITYSGIYRENTGINNLNEFNLSLANFKYIDKFFGSIQKLHARDTDLVVFQENKVSKVLYGKNLLSDSVGGGTVASIPEVLGTQVTYTGEYGIAKEPESFATWGNDMYFTDSNRGAVMRLGANGMFEISSQGMRDYFKDLFQGEKTQKIGAIDPFKNRYVLTSNDELSIPCDFSFKPIGRRGFIVGNAGQTIQVSVTATGAWSITLQDTGDGTSWIKVNGITPGPYNGYGNEVVDFLYSPNISGSDRSLQINFSGCSVSYPETTTQYARPIIIRPIVTIGNPIDSGLVLDEKYDFTSNTTGGDIEFNGVTLDDTDQAQTTTYTDYEGRNSIPTPGDTVELKAIEAGTATQKPFSPNLGNQLRYLVTDVPDLEKEIDTLISASTAVVPALVGGEYVGSFTYNRPSDEKYLYLIYDYRNEALYGGSLSGSAAITGTVNSFINYEGRRGNARLSCTPSGTNRFIVKWNNEVIADSGNVAAPVILEFFKNQFEPGKIQLTVEGGGAWNVSILTPTLTAFDIDTSEDTLATVCLATTSPSTRYHSGAGALPGVGDIVYNEITGTTLYAGGGAFHRMGPAPTTDYAVISDEGLVLSTGSCTSCSEVAVPVITQPAITLTQGDVINLKIPATNNPEEWAVVTTCLNYELDGGDDGALFTITNCITGNTESITVPGTYQQNICSSAAPVLVSGTGTFTAGATCDDQVLPPGISLDKLNGVFNGEASTTGTYTFDITATNCFGTSVNTSITITVNPPTENKRFNMDQVNPEGTSGDACSIPAPHAVYSIFYHDGEKDYPEINDFVSEYCNCKLRPFNGGYLWYVTDETSGGKNYVVRIDSTGQVVDKVLCP